MSTIITPSEDQINIVITDSAVNVNVTSEPVVVNVTEEIIQVSPISGAYPLPTTVYSVFGRTGSVVAQEGDYDLGKLSDVVLLDLANNDVLSYNGTNWVNEQMDLSGYVPYTGATDSLDLGEYSLLSNGVFTNSVTIDGGPYGEGGYLQFKQQPTTTAGLNNSTVISASGNNKLNIWFYHDFLDGVRYKMVNFKTDNLTIDQLRTYYFPDASGTLALTSDIPSLTGYVTLATNQIITGNKTFTEVNYFQNNTIFDLDAQFSIGHYLVKGGTPSGFAVGQVNVYSETSTNNVVFRDPSSKAKLVFNNSTQAYTFPAATGTIALTSDIPSTSTFVTLAGTQTITGSKSFTSGIKAESGLFLKEATSSGRLTGFVGISATATGATQQIQLLYPSTGASVLVFDASSTYAYTFPSATGTIALTSDIPSLTGYVPYTGATANVNLGAYSLTANALIKNGGVDTQFLKADGSVDNNVYLTANDLPSTLSLYATTTASAVSGYTKLVTTIDDPDYNTTAVDVSTGTITTADQFIAALISPVNLINGNPGVFNVSTYGNIKRVSGSGTAEFYFKIYKRTSAGVETLVGTSNNSMPVTSSIYTEFFSTALWNDGTFGVTDTIVLKYYATRISSGSNPTYNFQFGGTSPVRTLVPIPTAVIPNIYLAQLADVENVAPLNNEILYYNSTSTLWEHITIAGLLGYTPANDASVVHISGSETITGFKTFTPSITAASLIARGVYLNPSLTASAANDGLYALDVSPTFSNGAFTGVTNNGIRITTSTNRAFGGLLVSNTSSTGVSTASRIQVSSNTASVQLSSTASSYSTYGMTSASSNLLYASAGALSIISADSFISLGTGASGGTEGLRMFNISRNIQIKNGGTFADNGFKLEVVGTTRITDILTLGSTISNGTYSYTLPNASGTIALTSDIPSLSGYVPYTGATANVTLGAYSLTAASLIKSGGTSAEILAADGSVITAGTNITISGGTISASGGGGGSMAIGGAITGATTGSVLFVNSGATLAQDNANFFWDDTNNRLGIGITPTTAFHMAGDFTQQTSLNVAAQYWIVTRKSRGTAASPTAVLVNDEAGGIQFTGYDGATWRAGSAIRSRIQAVSLGTLSSNLEFYAGNTAPSSGTLIMSMRGDTKFVGIGTETIGSKLQVNGNAAIGYSNSTAAPALGLAVAGNTGFGTTTPGYTATSRQVVAINGGSAAGQGSILAFMQAGVNKGYVYSAQNNMEVWCESGILTLGNNAAAALILKTNNTDRLTVTATGEIAIGVGTAGSKLQVNGNAAIGYSASTPAPTSGLAVSGQVGIGLNSPVSSALLQLSSTTKGFLPPVMTTTEKNAIATPATGLVVFDSTLGKLCVFSTTWQTITSA